MVIVSFAVWFINDRHETSNVSGCEIDSGSCTISLSGRDLKITFGPMPAKSLTPMQLTIEVQGQQPDDIWVDIQGTDMYMGINQFKLTPSGKTWQGTTELAVCTTDQMRWLARVYVGFSGQAQQTFNLYFHSEAS